MLDFELGAGRNYAKAWSLGSRLRAHQVLYPVIAQSSAPHVHGLLLIKSQLGPHFSSAGQPWTDSFTSLSISFLYKGLIR